MYLSRIPLDVSNRKTQMALVSPNKFHGAIEEAFAERQGRNLWRIDVLKNEMYILILSQTKPDLRYIANQFSKSDNCGETKEYEALLKRIQKESVWQFRLVANPTHSIKMENGRGKVAAHTVEKYQIEWLNNQSVKRGFSILPDTMRVTGTNWKIFNKRNIKQKVRLLEVAYEGKLKVDNVEVFKNTLIKGIGREKAYGMGLMTIVESRG